MRALIGCEFSGVVRDAFIAKGHEAISCDLLPTERPGPHIQGDLFTVAQKHWLFDLMIFHWPCTNMAVSGSRWFPGKIISQLYDVNCFAMLMDECRIEKIAGENPVSVLSSQYRKPDQIIQPWMFGHGETKATCLWLKNLPKLVPTQIVEGRKPRVHFASPGPDRWKERSRTLPGIADAFTQWAS